MAPSVNAVRLPSSRRSSWSPERTAWWVTCLLVVAVPAVAALVPWAYGWLPWLTPSEHHAEFHHTPWQQLLVNAQPLLTLLLLALVAARPARSGATDDLVVQPATTCHSRPATQGALSSAR